jgi:hypothetical protein
MNMKTLPTLVLAIFAGSASAESLYLTCKTTSYPELNFKVFYRVVPANPRQKFISDIAAEGLMGVIVNKAESWEINTIDGQISSPEENSGPKFSDLKVTKTSFTAQAYSPGASYTFSLNRITGKLNYRIYLSKEETTPWRAKHGGTLPHTWEWEQLCTAESKPRI